MTRETTNNTLTILIVLLAALLLGVLGYAMFSNGDEDGIINDGIPTTTPQQNGDSDSTTTPDSRPGLQGVLRIDAPRANEVVSSPLLLKGEAAGWYFEATFPVRVESTTGTVLAQSYVSASGEWMTSEFVPFEGTISFSVPEGITEGYIVFAKSNPSGLPENEKEYKLPVRFETTSTQTVSYNVYFSNTDEDPSMLDCGSVYPVQRTSVYTQAVARAALKALFAGPTAEERNKGYTSQLPSGVEIQSLTVDTGGTAHVDFNAALQTGVGGSCRVTAIYAQIMETLKQFPAVNNVEITIDGESEAILQP